VRENRVTLAFLNAPAGTPATLAVLISSEGTARYFCFSATACVCATRLGCLGKLFVHFFLVGEQLLDARALLHALVMCHDAGEA
jgi:hypothetical protein